MVAGGQVVEEVLTIEVMEVMIVIITVVNSQVSEI